MKTPRRILVPTDFSDASDAAKVYGGVLAEALGASLHVLHVVPDADALEWGVDTGYLPRVLERAESEARSRLETLLTPEERSRFRAEFVVETGSPAARILEYADREQIDLIVMGTHGRGAIEKLWVGSVTERVVQRAQCPVVSLRQPKV
jgi:nucleotide-binding universal stress UspA family protein